MWKFPYKPEIAINAVLFLCQKAKENGEVLSFMQIAKLLFFADKRHLKKYGRPIIGDAYIKMDHGPNPSAVYDYLKDVRARGEEGDEFIYVESKANPPHAAKPFVHPKKEADCKVFSGSDLEILVEVFDLYGRKSAAELRRVSHQERAWTDADMEMAYEDFLDPDDEKMRNYIQESQDDWAGMDSNSMAV